MEPCLKGEGMDRVVPAALEEILLQAVQILHPDYRNIGIASITTLNLNYRGGNAIFSTNLTFHLK